MAELNQSVQMAEWYNNFDIVGLSVSHTDPLVSCSLILSISNKDTYAKANALKLRVPFPH